MMAAVIRPPPEPLVLGKPRGWFSQLWALLSLGVAGTSAQAIAARASDAMSLSLQYGAARLTAEHLRIVGRKPLVVSNGDVIGTEPAGVVLFGFVAFIASAIGLFLAFRQVLPKADRVAFDPKHERHSSDYDGANFLLFLGTTLAMFFTLSLVPKVVVGASMLVGAWTIDRAFARKEGPTR
jgi:hypothetical protein